MVRGPKTHPDSRNTAWAFAANDSISQEIRDYIQLSGSKTTSTGLLQLVILGLQIAKQGKNEKLPGN